MDTMKICKTYPTRTKPACAILSLCLVLVSCSSDPDPPVQDMGTQEDVSSSVDLSNQVDLGTSEDLSDSEDFSDLEDLPDPDPSVLDQTLVALRQDFEAERLRIANETESGWPLATEQGYLVVTDSTEFTHIAGDFDGWQGQALTQETGFRWAVISEGRAYKFLRIQDETQSNWAADIWSRAYGWDENGPISYLRSSIASEAHRERFFQIGTQTVSRRTVRVWVPSGEPTALLYAHDGQNLFEPDAINGGWRLNESAPEGLMIVGIDNTPERFQDYTHTTDNATGSSVGGGADAYLAMIKDQVRPLIAQHYGEPAKVGMMGSSLGGLVSLYAALTQTSDYDFVASLSGTTGWGSIDAQNQTIIDLFEAAAKPEIRIYIDSGGFGDCADSDGDGIEDDGDGTDNYCENKQLEAVLLNKGFVAGVDFWHWHEPGAPHNEAAWADRVFRPLAAFLE